MQNKLCKSLKKYSKKYVQILKELLGWITEVLNDEDFRKKTRKEAWHAFMYLVLSTIWAIVDAIVFIVLTSLWLHIVPSNIISDICWMITSFSLNLKKNFNMNDHVHMRWISYFTISLIWTALSTSMVYFFIEVVWIPNAIAKFMQILIMAIPLYLANRTLTFRDFSWWNSKKSDIKSKQYSNIKLPSGEVYKEAKNLLEAWKLVVFPTETIYGLGADARNDKAVLFIFELKWRPQDNPLITHLWYKEQIKDYATVENEIQQTIIDKLMPGPLTLLLKKKEWTISNRSCPLDYVWIRLPSNSVAQKFLQIAELPVAAPSANISWKPSPTNAQMVYDNLHDNVPLIIDDWESFAWIESSVMRVVPDEDKKWKLKIQILRPGFLTKEDLEDCFNHEIKVEYTTKNPELSPWMRYKHYSIAGHVRIFDDLNDLHNVISNECEKSIGVGVSSWTQWRILGKAQDSSSFQSSEWQTKIWILLTQELIDNNKKLIKDFEKNGITIIPRWTKSNLASCAHSLFDHYHTAEKSWINLLFVERLPEEWIGYGIMNRVKRSAEV